MIILQAWHIWVLLALFLFVLEVFYPFFLFAALGLAASVSALFSVFFNTEVQLAAFAVSGLIIFFAIRPFVLRYLYSTKDVKTNTQAMIGRTGIVIEDIVPHLNKGRVKVGGETWIGVSVDSQMIKKNEKVIIVNIEGTKLYVKKGE